MRKVKAPLNKPTLEIEHHSYQPTKEELEEPLSFPNTTPEELAKAVLRDVTLVRKPKREDC